MKKPLLPFLPPYSESVEARITGRTIKSVAFTGDISGKEILNVGALWGWYEDWILRDSKFKKLVGIDLPGTLIPELQEKYRGNERIDFVESDVVSLPFAKNSFDVVSMWEVMEHLPKNKELFALMEINRVLRKDGTLLLSTPHADWRAEMLDPIWYFGHRHYTVKQVEYLLSEAGFFDFKVEVYGGYAELFGTLGLYVFKHVFGTEMPFKSKIEALRKSEFEKPGFANIFIRATKNRDS